MIYKYKADLDYIFFFFFWTKNPQNSNHHSIVKFLSSENLYQEILRSKHNPREYITQKKKKKWKKETVSKRTTTTARASASHFFVRVWKQQKELESDNIESVKIFFFGWENGNVMKMWESLGFVYEYVFAWARSLLEDSALFINVAF